MPANKSGIKSTWLDWQAVGGWNGWSAAENCVCLYTTSTSYNGLNMACMVGQEQLTTSVDIRQMPALYIARYPKHMNQIEIHAQLELGQKNKNVTENTTTGD